MRIRYVSFNHQKAAEWAGPGVKKASNFIFKVTKNTAG